jgi:hypothetical protein
MLRGLPAGEVCICDEVARALGHDIKDTVYKVTGFMAQNQYYKLFMWLRNCPPFMEREGSLRPPQGKERANGRNLEPVACIQKIKTIFFKIYFSIIIQYTLVPSKLSLAFRFQHRSSPQSV